MIKTAYEFDEFGAFTIARPWPIDPLETEKARGGDLQAKPVYLDNGRRTETPPPVVPAGQCAIWTEGKWISAADYRGSIWYKPDGTPVLIAAPGDPTEWGLSPDAPEPEPFIPQPTVATDAERAAAAAALDALVAAGVISASARAEMAP